MGTKRKMNRVATAKNIVNKCNSSHNLCIDIRKFNEKKDDEAFLIECADFVRCDIVWHRGLAL